MSAKASTPTQGPGQPRAPTITKEKSAMEIEGSIAYPSTAAPIPHAARGFVVVCVAFSLQLAFCWRFILLSFSGTYYYYLYFFGFLGRRKSNSHPKFLLKGFLHGTALTLLTSLCISITPIHVVAPTLMDLWTPYAVHPALRTTKIVYDAGPSAELDIFAIHGLGSNPESAWSYGNNQSRVRWLRDLLPEEQGFRNTRVVMVNHQTRWDSNTAHMGLHEHASELLESIQSVHKDHPERPIVFIAHSFGGLLLKKALLLAKSRSRHVAEMTRGIVFLGVPHRGTHAAIVASCLSCMSFFRGSSSDMLELMAVDDPALLNLESEFYDSYVVRYHSHEIQPYICDVFELRPERVGKLVLGSIVRPKYGHLRHGRLVALDTDHRGLNKFQSSDDPNWQIFLRVLRQAHDHALQQSYPVEERCSPRIVPPLEPSPGPDSDAMPLASTAPGIVTVMVQDAPYLRMGTATSACLWGLQEWIASWLAGDRGRSGGYLTHRVPKFAIYGAIVKGPLAGLHLRLLELIFSGRNGVLARTLKGGLIMLTVLPSQIVLDHVMLAFISGARTFHQVSATIRVVFLRSLISQWVLVLLCLIFARPQLVTPDWLPFLSVTAMFTAEVYANVYIKKMRLDALRRRARATSKEDLSRLSQSSDDESGSPAPKSTYTRRASPGTAIFSGAVTTPGYEGNIWRESSWHVSGQRFDKVKRGQPSPSTPAPSPDSMDSPPMGSELHVLEPTPDLDKPDDYRRSPSFSLNNQPSAE